MIAGPTYDGLPSRFFTPNRFNGRKRFPVFLLQFQKPFLMDVFEDLLALGLKRFLMEPLIIPHRSDRSKKQQYKLTGSIWEMDGTPQMLHLLTKRVGVLTGG
jgi:hypothetical protein